VNLLFNIRGWNFGLPGGAGSGRKALRRNPWDRAAARTARRGPRGEEALYRFPAQKAIPPVTIRVPISKKMMAA